MSSGAMAPGAPARGAASLHRRLTLLLLGMLAAVWACTAVVSWFDARHEVEEILDSHLAQAAALLVARTPPDGADTRIDTPVLHRYAAKTALQVWRDGALVLRSATAPVEPLAPGAAAGFHTVRVDGAAWRVLVAPGHAPGVRVQAGQAVAARDDVLWAVFRSTLWPMLLALPLLGLGVWWAVQRGLRPLHALERTLRTRQPGALEHVPTAGLPREMLPVVQALNLLFARIEVLLGNERRFTADAAHELRTPIAAIRAHAEVALREADPGQRQHALQRTLQGCDRATHLVAQLLMLSRLEARPRAARCAVDLPALARQVLAELAPAALAQGQTLALIAAAPWEIEGDEALLEVLLRNLVDNALRHSGRGTRITVSMHAGPDGTHRLQVEDSGPGMAAPALERLGERFFRPAGSQAGGSGLGWSIAERIAAVHGLRLTAQRSRALGGFAAVLWG